MILILGRIGPIGIASFCIRDIAVPGGRFFHKKIGGD